MANGNNLTVTGNCTRDPELRFTPSGQAVTSFGIAWNNRWQNRTTNEWEEAVHFFDVTCWAKLAENVAESITKGTRITVVGRLDHQSWENEAGEKRSKVQILADDVMPSLRYATAIVEKNERTGGYQSDAPLAGEEQYGGDY